MGLCDIVLEINTVDPDTGDSTTNPFVVQADAVDKDSDVTLAMVADVIAEMPIELRTKLIDDLVAAKTRQLTDKMIKDYRFVGNITLQGLIDKYPGLKDAVNMDTETMSSYNILYKPNFNLSGHNYSGRVIGADGQELFIVKNYYGALNLFRFIQAKERAIDVFEGNEALPEGLTEDMLADLKAIAERKGLSLANTVIDYLTDRSSYKNDIASKKEGRIIHTAYVMANVAGILADDYETFKTKYTELEQTLYANVVMRGKKAQKFGWIIAKSKLYSIICTFNPSFAESCSEDDFNKLDEKQMQAKFIEAGVFLGNPKLERAEVTNVDKTPEETDKKNKSKPVAYVTLSFPFKRIGKLYNFGFDTTESIFTPVLNEGPVMDGKYKGMYVYKATFANGRSEYFISRNLISPESYSDSYKSLKEALRGIDKHVSSDTISEHAFLEFRQGEEGFVPRKVTVGSSQIREGQIVTVRNDMLVKTDMSKLPVAYRSLMGLTVPALIEKFKASDGSYRLKGVNNLLTPEQAGTFIYKLATEVFTKEDYDSVSFSSTSVSAMIDLICKNAERAEVALESALSEESGVRHYLVERLFIDHVTGNRTAVLKLLRHNGVDISDDVRTVGDLSTKDFINLTLTNAIKFFHDSYGVDVHEMTSEQLKQFSLDNKLGFENRVDSIRGFIYNGEIYINTTTANAKDLYHEISHLYLGVLKVRHPDLYAKLMDHYAHNRTNADIRRRYLATLNNVGSEYKTLARADLEEEVVVRMIANELFNDGFLSLDGFDGSVYQDIMNRISTTVDMFTKEEPNEDLMFGTMMSDLASSRGETKKKRIITNFIQQKIQSEAIKENCD